MTPAGAPTAQESAARPHVLLVDDDDVNLMLVRAALVQHGFDVTEASDGESALMLLRHWVPDVIVLDARMPGLDGFETCRELRRMYGFDNVPVLMLTGLDDEASINRAYQAGATDFFVKSTQWSLLAGRLSYMLRSANTTRELKRSREKLVMAQELAQMGSFDWRVDRQFGPLKGVQLSEQALRVLGFGMDDVASSRNLFRLVPETERKALIRKLRRLLHDTSAISLVLPIYLASGHQSRIIQVVAEPEFGEFAQCLGYSGVVQDITERRITEDTLLREKSTDKLTQLPNRQQMSWLTERAVEQARRMGRMVALLLIDLDRFKKVNDTLGHNAGDDVLLEVGRRLRLCVFHGDTQDSSADEPLTQDSMPGAVGRIGGDEFIALLPDIQDPAEAERMAERILVSLREPVNAAGQELFATASIGIAVYPRDGHSVDELMRSADVAMYAAKDHGRNTAKSYNLSQSGRGLERLELETALHKALERNELLLYYQPQIDVQTNRMIGVEALMRWNRDGQIVPPGAFIETAEETGLIVPMSEWAIREAARQAHEWQKAFGFNQTIAVNVPGRVFMRTDLLAEIKAAVYPYQLPPSIIQLEITENSLREDELRILSTLHALTEIGIQISVDDFGTGYSSLSRLTSLPIAEVKIDRSFVKDLGAGPKSTVLINTIVALAKALDLRVIAEGVETSSQVRELMALGCTHMQGFYFSRPVPPDQLQAWAIQYLKAGPADGFDDQRSALALAMPTGRAT